MFIGRYVSVLVIAALGAFPLLSTALTQAEIDAERQKLKDEIVLKELEIQAERIKLLDLKNTRAGYEEEAAYLEAQIKKATASIRQRELAIKDLDYEVAEKADHIDELSDKYSREVQSLAQILRRTREADERSMVEFILSGEQLSEAFMDIDQFEVLKKALRSSFEEITQTQDTLRTEQEQLRDAKASQEELKIIQELERKETSVKKSEKDSLARQVKVSEDEKAQTITEKEAEVAAIRAKLFELRGSAAIPFGDAYDYAKEASGKIGVRPALILAILKQETNLGENVGQCLLTNSPNKGDGKGMNTGRAFAQVMKGTRDVDPFMEITSELGIDPYNQPVSCPPGYGYGGAMGPAQFIPSTWVLYKDRLGKLTGEIPPNPWHARTAIFATTLLMADNGADKGTYAAERLAALRYFAGWGNANKPAYAFYGDSVMELADDMQEQIDILER